MRHALAFCALCAMVSAAAADTAGTEAELAAVADLGQVNGIALACNRADLVTKAKALMVARVPKTRAFGEAFETSTNDAFRAQGSEACPVDVVLSLRLEAADLKLGNAFPPMVPSQQ